jgi:hypothetical protein
MNELYCWGGVADNEEAPSVSLEISPNPCRGRCEIRYSLAEAGEVTLTLTTIDGRQFILIDRKFHEKGDYDYKLVPHQIMGNPGFAGLVTVRISAGKGTAAGKLVVLE